MSPHPGSTWRQAIAFIGAVGIALTGATVAVAATDDTDATAAAVSEAAGGADAVVDAAPADSGQLVAEVTAGTVSVDTEPGGAATITSTEGEEISIGLPLEVETAAGEEAADGSIVFKGLDSTDVVVQVLDDGTRMSTVIRDRQAPTRFSYPLSEGIEPFIEADGSVSLLKQITVTDPESGQELTGTMLAGTIAAPWARDAAGRDLRTWYEVDGSVLTQVVKHRVGGVTYPVVADPEASQSWLNRYIWFNHAETKTLADSGWGAAAISALCALAGGPPAGLACLLITGPLVYTAGVANNSSPRQCVAVRWTYAVVINYAVAFTYHNSHCW